MSTDTRTRRSKWTWRAIDGQWCLQLKDHSDHERLLAGLTVGDVLTVQARTRSGVASEVGVKVTHLAYGQGRAEEPTRADAVVVA